MQLGKHAGLIPRIHLDVERALAEKLLLRPQAHDHLGIDENLVAEGQRGNLVVLGELRDAAPPHADEEQRGNGHVQGKKHGDFFRKELHRFIHEYGPDALLEQFCGRVLHGSTISLMRRTVCDIENSFMLRSYSSFVKRTGHQDAVCEKTGVFIHAATDMAYDISSSV